MLLPLDRHGGTYSPLDCFPASHPSIELSPLVLSPHLCSIVVVLNDHCLFSGRSSLI